MEMLIDGLVLGHNLHYGCEYGLDMNYLSYNKLFTNA